MKAYEFGSLIRGITLNVNLFISSKLEKHGIKQGQFEYFLIINSTPGINQLELARLKNVGKASVTKALKILEENGFIRRETGDNDRRNILCFVSEKGEKIVNDLLDVKTTVDADIFEGFSENDKIAFYKYLSKLYKNSENLITSLNIKKNE